MRVLLNTLYVTTPDAYLSLDGENVVILKEKEVLRRVPLHNLSGIVAFGYTGASPALMGACAKRSVALTFLSMHGRFLAQVVGEVNGNVLLRREQYRIADQKERSLEYAKGFLTGKLFNSRWVLARTARDYALRVGTQALKEGAALLGEAGRQLEGCDNLDTLLGIEGQAATVYFGLFDQMILQQKEAFSFRSRNKRPPLDPVNALLSFLYTLLSHDCSAALLATGLDPYVGFLHQDRPGRRSLALDLMEELRSVYADRFVLSLINQNQVGPDGFTKREDGAVIMDEDTRKTVLSFWQSKKQEPLTHPFLNEKICWGLVPYVQAQLLARTIRNDIDAYPPFLWK